MSLFSSMTVGGRALGVFQSGIASAGHNVANASTPGFTRTTLDLLSERSMIGGVRSEGMTRVDDPLLARRERASSGALGHAGELRIATSEIEGALAGESLSDSMAAFFASLTDVSGSPTDPALRQQVIARAQEVTDSFHRMADAVHQAGRDAEDRISAYAANANELAAELAEINTQMLGNEDPTLMDRRDQVAKELAGLVGGYTIQNEGGMRYMLEDGSVLVDGANVTAVDTDRVSSGKIAAQKEVRDDIVPQMMNDLDRLAFEFSDDFNQAHRAFAGMDGASGRNFFEATSVPGAASGIAIDSAIRDDASLIAGADVGLGAGDNSGFTAMANMADGPYVDDAIGVLQSLGTRVVSAENALTVAESKAETLASMRDSLSGVSIEEEMVRLTQFQRAAEASLRFVQTVDGLLGDLIDQL